MAKPISHKFDGELCLEFFDDAVGK